MPVLEKILIQDFRNIPFAELRFVPGVNCICGDNGQGKTNLLDAVYYLSMTKSAFGTPDRLCMRHGAASFSIAGTFAMQDGLHSRFSISVDDNGKVLKRDDKLYERLAAHIGALPVVIISPCDSSLVNESGEERRRFVNAVLSQMSQPYLLAIQKYNRLLAQRNRVLKGYRPDVGLMAVMDAQMAEEAATIASARKEFASRLEQRVSEYYRQLCDGSESVGIAYRTDVLDPAGVPVLKDLLDSSRERDLYLKYTSVGVQRDDFVFTMEGYPIRKCGSQGQQKSFLVALKLAQYDIMKESYGFPPLLLLDDVFDKLDVHRISNLLKVVSSQDYGQIFITDTNRGRMEEIVGSIAPDAAFFTASNGEFQTGEN